MSNGALVKLVKLVIDPEPPSARRSDIRVNSIIRGRLTSDHPRSLEAKQPGSVNSQSHDYINNSLGVGRVLVGVLDVLDIDIPW